MYIKKKLWCKTNKKTKKNKRWSQYYDLYTFQYFYFELKMGEYSFHQQIGQQDSPGRPDSKQL